MNRLTGIVADHLMFWFDQVERQSSLFQRKMRLARIGDVAFILAMSHHEGSCYFHQNDDVGTLNQEGYIIIIISDDSSLGDHVCLVA